MADVPPSESNISTCSSGRVRDWCSLCPYMSMQRRPISFKVMRVERLPFMNILLRPLFATTRLMRRFSALAMPDSSSISLMPFTLATSKSASARASSLPLLMTSTVARSPRIRSMASIMMLLPAPVSPVKTLKPGPREMERLSIMARCFMLSSSNITWLRLPFLLAFPQKPFPEYVEISLALAPSGDNVNAFNGPLDLYRVPRLKLHVHLPVKRQGESGIVGRHGNFNAHPVRHHDRPVHQIKRAYRNDYYGMYGRVKYRPPCREGVGGGAGRGGYYKPVRPVRGNVFFVYAGGELDQTRHPALYHDVVQDLILGVFLFVSRYDDREHHALFDRVIAFYEFFEIFVNLVHLYRGQKPEPAHVDAQNSYLFSAQEPRGVKDGPVAA